MKSGLLGLMATFAGISEYSQDIRMFKSGSNPIYFPKKHPKQTWGAQRRLAKQRKKSKIK